MELTVEAEGRDSLERLGGAGECDPDRHVCELAGHCGLDVVGPAHAEEGVLAAAVGRSRRPAGRACRRESVTTSDCKHQSAPISTNQHQSSPHSIQRQVDISGTQVIGALKSDQLVGFSSTDMSTTEFLGRHVNTGLKGAAYVWHVAENPG